MADPLSIASGIVLGNTIGKFINPFGYDSENHYIIYNRSSSIRTINNEPVKPVKHVIKDFIDESKIHCVDHRNFNGDNIVLIEPKRASQISLKKYYIRHNETYLDVQTPWMSLHPNQIVIGKKDDTYQLDRSFLYINKKHINKLMWDSIEFGIVVNIINDYFRSQLNHIKTEYEKTQKIVITHEKIKKKQFFGLTSKVVQRDVETPVQNKISDVKLAFSENLKLKFITNAKDEVNISIDDKNIKSLEDFVESITKHHLYRLTFRLDYFLYSIKNDILTGTISISLIKIESKIAETLKN